MTSITKTFLLFVRSALIVTLAMTHSFSYASESRGGEVGNRGDASCASAIKVACGSYGCPEAKQGPSIKNIQKVQQFLPEIMHAAMFYRIDPRALVGSILMARTINISPIDRGGNIIPPSVMKFIESISGLREPYQGIARIDERTAQKVEPVAHIWEGRTTRKPDEIKKEFDNHPDSTSILYAAATLRAAQDEYMKAGFNVSGSPEILTTLYSVGDWKTRAEKAKAEKRQPQMNFWGAFYVCNQQVVQNVLKNIKTLPGAQVNDNVVFPAEAKVTNWVFKSMKSDGTYESGLKLPDGETTDFNASPFK